jgi:hypothetical protein
LVALICAALFAVGVWRVYFAVSGDTPPAGPITSPGPMYVVFGIGGIILPLALLCANAVSWLVPPLRNANLRAFQGKGVSFKSMNIGLIKFALVSLPAGLLALLVAAIQPWSS